jgi:hypothetical protein
VAATKDLSPEVIGTRPVRSRDDADLLWALIPQFGYYGQLPLPLARGVFLFRSLLASPVFNAYPSSMPLTAGTWFGPYEIQSMLGVGGMGEAVNWFEELKRLVSVK